MTTNKNTTPTTPTSPTETSALLAVADVKGFTFGPNLQDVRGWAVIGPGAARLGTVDRVLVDRDLKQPRYLSVALPEKRGFMLLPIGAGDALPKAKEIRIDLSEEMLKALPTLMQELVPVEVERKVVEAVAGPSISMGAPSKWYSHPAFDASRLFSARPKTKLSA